VVKRAARFLSVALTVVCPALAQAGHSDAPDVDYLAETLDQWDVRLSPTRLDVGVYENVSVGLYYPLWLLKAREIHARWTFYQTEKWAVATQLGFLRFRPKDLIEDFDTESTFRIVPFELVGTYTYRPDLRFSLGIAYAEVSADTGPIQVETDTTTTDEDGEESDAVADVEGTLGISTGRLELAAEWRMSDFMAFSAEAQVLLVQKGGGAGTQSFQVDERTTVEVQEKGSADLKTKPQGNLGGAVTWASDTLHLKAGLYYGHYALPIVGAFIPTPTLIPELDFSWRW
jgi:hypothetical protein